jgi:hypothetical protein
MTISSQVCRKCGIEKELTEYHRDNRTSNRKRTICRECRNVHRRIVRISKDNRASLLEEQNYSCAICGSLANENKKRLSVDHNHETNQIRGLLCTYCNVGLGYFKDDTQLMARAIEYLDKHNGIA